MKEFVKKTKTIPKKHDLKTFSTPIDGNKGKFTFFCAFSAKNAENARKNAIFA